MKENKVTGSPPEAEPEDSENLPVKDRAKRVLKTRAKRILKTNREAI